jgi:hypothetical protein
MMCMEHSYVLAYLRTTSKPAVFFIHCHVQGLS